MKRSLVVGVDGTDESRNALARAAELARAAGLRLVVVHVRHIPVLAGMSAMTMGPATQDLDVTEAATRRASENALQGSGVDWEFVVRGGDPAHELMATADDRSAAAIVVGGRPHRAPVSGLVASVDAALVHRFHGSVLVVRGDDSDWHPRDAALPGGLGDSHQRALQALLPAPNADHGLGAGQASARPDVGVSMRPSGPTGHEGHVAGC